MNVNCIRTKRCPSDWTNFFFKMAFTISKIFCLREVLKQTALFFSAILSPNFVCAYFEWIGKVLSSDIFTLSDTVNYVKNIHVATIIGYRHFLKHSTVGNHFKSAEKSTIFQIPTLLILKVGIYGDNSVFLYRSDNL